MRMAWVLQGIEYLILSIGTLYFVSHKNNTPTNQKTVQEINDVYTLPMQDSTFFIHSPAFQNGQRIPSKYTCDGDDVPPPLALENIPQYTVSLVLIVDDPDAPSGTWDHWILFNIPKDTTRIAEDIAQTGTHGKTSWGNTSYGGPCPPHSTHRYFFKIYALDTNLRLPEGSTKEEVLEAMKGHILKQSELMGTYTRE